MKLGYLITILIIFTEAIYLLTLKPLKKTLSDKLSRLENNSCSEFEKAFLTVLNKQAPLKSKILRHNKNLFMTNGLSLKHGFGGCGHGFGRYYGLGGLGGFSGLGGFDGFGGFSGLGGFVF